jgi:two-component system sensor histidine kinase BaeS
MSAWRPLAVAALVAVAGAGGTLIAGAATGMGPSELVHLAILLAPAAVVTVVSAAAAGALLRRASFRQRLVGTALVAVLVSLGNLAALAALMFVSARDAALMALLLLYAVGAGVGAAMVLARTQSDAVERLAQAARRLAEGDLEARVGALGAGPELEALGRALDEMAARLGRSLEAERRAVRTKTDLVIALSHDLRTPLAGLRAMVEAIEDRVVDDPPTLRRYVSEMGRQVETLVGLVDDLFELAQLDAGAVLAESRRARLADLISSAVEACAVQAEAKRLVVERRLDGAGDAACSPRLVRVLQNLLQNAIRHTPTDGTVLIRARRTRDAVEVVVADTGEGIAPDAVERVFEPFWRGDPARSGPGAGLGLAVAKRIVEALGGRITVDSAPDRGARFAVILPG